MKPESPWDRSRYISLISYVYKRSQISLRHSIAPKKKQKGPHFNELHVKISRILMVNFLRLFFLRSFLGQGACPYRTN